MHKWQCVEGLLLHYLTSGEGALHQNPYHCFIGDVTKWRWPVS